MNYGTDSEISGSDDDHHTSGEDSETGKRQSILPPIKDPMKPSEHVNYIQNDDSEGRRGSDEYNSIVRLRYEHLEGDDSVIEISDTETTHMPKDDCILQAQNDVLWSYFTVTPLNITYLHLRKINKDRRISCTTFGECKFVTSDSERKSSTSNMGTHSMTSDRLHRKRQHQRD